MPEVNRYFKLHFVLLKQIASLAIHLQWTISQPTAVHSLFAFVRSSRAASVSSIIQQPFTFLRCKACPGGQRQPMLHTHTHARTARCTWDEGREQRLSIEIGVCQLLSSAKQYNREWKVVVSVWQERATTAYAFHFHAMG